MNRAGAETPIAGSVARSSWSPGGADERELGSIRRYTAADAE
jgi:hypothetical protein